MQISENLLRVIFMLSTIVAVTDCCSSRLLLLKEHTLQIVQQHRLHNAHIDDYDYEHEDYEHLQQQQHEQQHLEQQHQLQQQKMPQYVDIVSSGIEFLKNLTNEYARFRDEKPEQEENTTETQLIGGTMDLEDFGGDSFQSLLGIFDAAAFETTTARTTTNTSTTSNHITSTFTSFTDTSTITIKTTPTATSNNTK
uniref:Protein gurken n=1 Tax=Ceratitis capitata TaxID=7213 RepID=W8B0T3_CERCA